MVCNVSISHGPFNNTFFAGRYSWMGIVNNVHTDQTASVAEEQSDLGIQLYKDKGCNLLLLTAKY